ncbi:hypothetical protein MASR2M15_17190 [Anaerolineales bacterium]
MGQQTTSSPFSNISLGKRLNFIIVFVNIAVLVFVAFLTLSFSNTALINQAENVFSEQSSIGGDVLNSILNQINLDNKKLVEQILASENPFETDSLLNIIKSNLPDHSIHLIQQINVIRPDDKLVSFFVGNPKEGNIQSHRVYSDKNIPYQRITFPAYLANDINRPIWFFQAEEPFSQDEVLSVAYPIRTDAEEFGLLWVDINSQDLKERMVAAVHEHGLATGISKMYAFIVDEIGKSIIYINLDPALIPQYDDNLGALLSTLRASPTRNGVIQLDDPISGEASIASIHRLPINNWQLITVLPKVELPALPNIVVLPMIMVSVIGVILLVFILGRFINNSITKPLSNLRLAASELGSGDLRYQIAYQNQTDEIGWLARSLEDMKRNIAHSYEELSNWSQTLEKRVSDRTLELEEARQKAQIAASELRAVYDESLQVVREPQLEPLLNAFLQRVSSLLKSSYAAVWLLNPARTHLLLVASSNERDVQATRIIGIQDGLAGQSFSEEKGIIIDSYDTYPNRIRYPEGTRPPLDRAMATPLTFASKAIGTIVIGRNADSDAYHSDDLRMLTLFANLVSPAVRNAQLFVQREDALQEAERANQVKTRFLASVTHELRTPLNLIINNMDFMRIGAFGEVNNEQVGRLNQTVRSAEHLLYLINDLLDVSKIDAGEMQLFLQEMELEPILEDAVDSGYALMEKIEGKAEAVQLITNIPDNLPKIVADSRRVRQILNNLISNAIKFTEAGSVSLKVSYDETHVIMQVSDTGMGIAEEDMANLFEAFERSKSVKAKAIEGTGLGLPITNFLINLHRGTLQVESKINEGTSFTVKIPIKLSEIEETSEQGSLQLIDILTAKTDQSGVLKRAGSSLKMNDQS